MELWTSAHLKTLLPALVVMVIVTVLLGLWLGKKSLRVRMIPLQIVTVILLILEISKQILSLIKGYDLYHIPLHFCSLMLIALPLISFYRGKHTQLVSGMACALTSAVFLLTVIYPNLIYSAGNISLYFSDFFSFHTVTFHNLVLFAFMLMVALRLHTPGKWEARSSVAFVGIYCIVAAIVSHVLKTNFNNLYSCNIAPLESVRTMMHGLIGYVPTQILYVIIVTSLDMAFVTGAYWFYRLCRRLICGKEKAE